MTYFYRMYKNADHKELTQNISKHLSAHFTSATLKHSLVITVQTARQESGPFSFCHYYVRRTDKTVYYRQQRREGDGKCMKVFIKSTEISGFYLNFRKSEISDA